MDVLVCVNFSRISFEAFKRSFVRIPLLLEKDNRNSLRGSISSFLIRALSVTTLLYFSNTSFDVDPANFGSKNSPLLPISKNTKIENEIVKNETIRKEHFVI